MRESIAKVWVDALRSDDYKQGTDYLCKDNHYCCLGVLCDLYEKETNAIGFKRVKTSVRGDDTAFYGGCHETLPAEVVEWAEMSSHIGSYVSRCTDYQHSLAELNDEGHAFEELADIIEVEYEQL